MRFTRSAERMKRALGAPCFSSLTLRARSCAPRLTSRKSPLYPPPFYSGYAGYRFRTAPQTLDILTFSDKWIIIAPYQSMRSSMTHDSQLSLLPAL